MFDWGSRTYVMGILNATPDSFSGDGLLSREDAVDAALRQAKSFLDAGVDILDIGGESTRPGARPVNAEEERERVIPILRAIHKAFPNAFLSVDTSKAEVAAVALDAGARMVNDVWGFRADARMAEVAAQREAFVVLMHNRSQPAHAEIRERLGGRYVGMEYENLLDDVRRELMESVALAHAAGVPDEKIILDPGVGFGKTVEQNLTLLNHLDEIKALGYPVLIGTSRKSFIGYTLDLPPEERLEGTAATVTLGIVRGADIVRVHDVEAMTRVARMTDALLRA